MRSLFERIALTAAVLTVLAPGAATAGGQVPLKGGLKIVPAGPPTINYPLVTQTRFISGRLTHLGETAGAIVQTVDLQTLTFSGEFTLVAANGDTVTGEAGGFLIPTSDPNVFDVVEEVTITGGTGRFAGATGSAIGSGEAFQDSGLAEETFSGTISSPGS